MPNLRQSHVSPYSVQQLFELVADVESYPQFLPWCRAARILSRGEGEFHAELLISFKHMSESYTSRVQLFPAASPREGARIEVNMTKGPFSHLTNYWQFTPLEDGTQVDFELDFDFRSFLLQKFVGPMFSSAAEEMGEAFQNRAHALYGKKGA